MAHERKRITGNHKKPPTPEQKKQRLEAKTTEWGDWEYSVRYCWLGFIIAQSEKGNRQDTINYYNRFWVKFEKFLASVWKDYTADQMPAEILLSDFIIPLFRNYIGKTGNVQTVNSYLRAFRAFGNWCEKEGYIDGFDCPIKEEEPPIKQVYTDKELDTLLVKPPLPIDKNFSAWRTFLIISLVLNTGARTNTILHLRINEIELDTGYVNFNFTKAHQVVRLKLDRKLNLDFKNWIDWLYSKGAIDTDYMFPNEYGEQMARSTITKSIRHYNLSRGVEKTSLHLLRHTFAKKWITSGGDIVTLAKVLTHSELEMVKRYSNLYATDIKKELEEHSALAQMKTRSGQTLRTRRKLTD